MNEEDAQQFDEMLAGVLTLMPTTLAAYRGAIAQGASQDEAMAMTVVFVQLMKLWSAEAEAKG